MLAQKREVVLHFDSSQRSRFRFLFCCIIKLYAKREDRAETPFGEIRIPSSDTVEERTILQRILRVENPEAIIGGHLLILEDLNFSDTFPLKLRSRVKTLQH